MVVSRGESLQDICAEISLWGAIGLDTETTGLTQADKIFSLILSNGVKSFYFNFTNAPGTPEAMFLDRELVFGTLEDYLFSNPDLKWFIHNAKFDMRMLAKEGCTLAGEVHCTFAIERIVQNNYFGKDAYKLAGLASRRGLQKDDAVDDYITKNKLYKDVPIPGKKKAHRLKYFDQVPYDIMVKYGENDARLHAIIGLDQEIQIDRYRADTRFPALDVVFANEKALTKVCFDMERRGLKINRPFVEQAAAFETNKIASLKEEFYGKTGHEFVDGRALFKTVFDAAGESYPTTAKGNPSFAADVLEAMQSPVARIINDIRHHEKRLGTYYSSFLHYADKRTDLVHADAVQGGTEPGRFSYRDPNLQNVPKEDDEEDKLTPFHVRDSFIPEEGHFFYTPDHKQMEYRMMLDFAGEMDLIAAVMAGEDVHEATARLCGITRGQAKTLNFALLYGAGVGKIASMLGCTMKEAAELKDIYFGKLPKVERFLWEVSSIGRARGFIFNWAGRRCHISEPGFAYVLPNHIIQGGCSDVVKIAMVRIDRRLKELGYRTTMRLQVHDELIFSVPFGEERVIEVIQPIMESVYEPRNGMVLATSVEHAFKGWGVRNKIKGVPYAKAG